jgi:hypothetical protein
MVNYIPEVMFVNRCYSPIFNSAKKGAQSLYAL